MKRVLVVEDEASIRELVALNLKMTGWEVLEAPSAERALELIQKNPPCDVALLDIMLPGMDGFSLCETIRHGDPYIGIIMASAKGQESDKIRGLSIGADDYITKPFSPIVLSARVRAIEKRCHQRSEGVYQAGELSVNEIRREACVAGQTVDLTPKEYELLIYFKNNQNIAVSRENILNAVWGYDYFGDLRTVDTHVKKLRAKLGDCGKMIETVRGFGYRFEGEQQ